MRGEAECECGGLIVIVSLGWWLHVGWAGGGCGSGLVSFVTDWHKAQGTRHHTLHYTTSYFTSPATATWAWDQRLARTTLSPHSPETHTYSHAVYYLQHYE